MYLFFIALKKYLTGLLWELCRSFFTFDQISSWNPPFLIFFIIPSHLRIKHAFAVLVQQSLLKMGNIRSLNYNYKAGFNLHLKISFGIKWAQISPKLQISALLLMYTLVGVFRNYINQKIFSSSKNGHYWSYLIICLQSDHFCSQHRPVPLKFFFQVKNTT